MRTLHAVPQRRNGDCDPHEAQIDIPVNLPRTSFALQFNAHPLNLHRLKEGVVVLLYARQLVGFEREGEGATDFFQAE